MRLFDNENKPELSREMIAVQSVNDASITEITNLFQKLIDEQGNYALNSNKSFFTKKPFKAIITRLDTVIKDRFGVKVKHIDGGESVYGVMTNPPVNFNVLNNDIPDIYEGAKSILNTIPNKDNSYTDDINSYKNNYFEIISKWKKSMDSLEDKLASESVIVDLQAAKVRNLPKNYVIFILANFKYLIDKVNLTAKEMTAIFLHEIGHFFTHLEYSYRTVNNTNVLLDSMQEYIIKKGMSPKKAIALTYNDLGGNEDLNDVSTATAVITLTNQYRKASLGMTDSTHSQTDSEMLADQFAARFGYGDELVSALDLIGNEIRSPFNTLIFLSSTIMYLTILAVILSLLAGSIISGIGIILAIVGGVYISTAFIDTFATKGGTNSDLVYDTDKQRYQRIKNEMVRQLRTMTFDKKTVKNLLTSIDNISKLIDITPAVKPNLLNKLYRLVFSTSSNRYLTLKETDELIENLQENDLYINSNKLKGLL